MGQTNPEQKSNGILNRSNIVVDLPGMLLKGGIVASILGAFGATLERTHTSKEQSNQIKGDWEKAHDYSSAEAFVEANKDWLRNIELGFNHSDEHLWWLYNGEERTAGYSELMPTPAQAIDKT